MEEDALGFRETEALQAQEPGHHHHPALRKLAHVLRTFEDCTKELASIEELLFGEELGFRVNGWREELHLVAVHTRERLTQLTQEMQANFSLAPISEQISDSDEKTTSSIVMENDVNIDESLRRDSQSQRWCPHVCESHHEMMDPALWKKLPESLVELIFARLPLHNVIQLQSLSKSWRYTVRYSKPFHNTLFPAPRFALVTSNQCRDCKIHFCDVKENKWLLKTMDAVSNSFWASPVIAAEGLLCIVDLHQLSYGSLSISMCNPLTHKSRVLPPLTHFNRWFPKMMQLLVDECHYKLIVVGSSHRAPETLILQVYDSQVGAWEFSDVNPAPGRTYRDSTTSICGYDFSYDGQYEGIVRYDTRERSLYRLVLPSHPNMVQAPTKNDIGMCNGEVFAVVGTLRNKEVVFKLGADPVSGNVEWVAQEGGASASGVNNNSLVSFPRTYYKRVFVAGSLLLVAADNRERADVNHHQILMVKDLAADDGQWMQLPKLGKCDMWELNHAVMMELRWDATP